MVLLVRGRTKTFSHSFVTLSLPTSFRFEMERSLKINVPKYSTNTATLCLVGERSFYWFFVLNTVFLRHESLFKMFMNGAKSFYFCRNFWGPNYILPIVHTFLQSNSLLLIGFTVFERNICYFIKVVIPTQYSGVFDFF